jgi:hypothetical protein
MFVTWNIGAADRGSMIAVAAVQTALAKSALAAVRRIVRSKRRSNAAGPPALGPGARRV